MLEVLQRTIFATRPLTRCSGAGVGDRRQVWSTMCNLGHITGQELPCHRRQINLWSASARSLATSWLSLPPTRPSVHSDEEDGEDRSGGLDSCLEGHMTARRVDWCGLHGFLNSRTQLTLENHSDWIGCSVSPQIHESICALLSLSFRCQSEGMIALVTSCFSAL